MKKGFKKELIGSIIEIIGSKNKTLIGIKGKIIDETKNTLTIKNKTSKKVLKSHITFKIDGKIVEGKDITKRPEDRIKK
jgi:ribonuclease P protein subunit POP4|tara:strand:+ start:452 stop:688 length:237 start_codon:yes stop_codon:yes gene_type:complete